MAEQQLFSVHQQNARSAPPQPGAAAEEHPAESGAERKDTGAAPTATEPPKLFQYHLPFVLVRELRSKWLGLDERIADDDMLCGEFAVKHGGATAPVAPETPTP